MRQSLRFASQLAAISFLFIAFSNAEARILNVPDDYQTIQAGIDASEDGDTVLVAPGVYLENLTLEQSDIVVGSLILTTNVFAYTDSTIIDANQEGSGVTFFGAGETSILRGFTIRNGFHQYGGGISCVGEASPTLVDLVVKDNHAREWGGGILAADFSHITMLRVIVINNRADRGGGGVAFMGASPVLEDCVIANNTSPQCGAQTAVVWSLEMRNVLIHGNISGRGSPAILIRADEGQSPVTLDHLTIAHNISQEGEQNIVGIRIVECDAQLSNSIVFDNGENEISVGAVWASGVLKVEFSDIEGGEELIELTDDAELDWPDGNIDSDPLFLDPDNGDYRLSADSPCIDAGDPDAPPDPDGTRADMGAFYFHQRDIEVEPREIHFPAIPWGYHDSTTIEIRNVGRTPLQISSVITPNNMACIGVRPEFGVNDPPIEIAPDSILILSVYFDPDINGGPLNSSISIGSNDPDEPEISIHVDGEVLDVPSDILHSSFFTLHSAYPNPFNSSTTIQFSVGAHRDAPLRLAVYGIDGQLVADLLPGRGGSRTAPTKSGEHSIIWNADGLPGGIYLIRLEAGSQVKTSKVVLLK